MTKKSRGALQALRNELVHLQERDRVRRELATLEGQRAALEISARAGWHTLDELVQLQERTIRLLRD